MATDFTNNPQPVNVTLAGGVGEEVGTLGTRTGLGVSEFVIISIKGVSGVALTDCKLQVRNHPSFGWSDYLDGADWVSTVNGAQRNWTSDQSPTDLDVGETATAQVKTIGYAYMRLLVTGTAATVLTVQMQAVTYPKNGY